MELMFSKGGNHHMVRELYQTMIREIALNITQSKIDSVRIKNITKSGCRLYDNGIIGIAGTLGEPTEETWELANNNLKKHIPYEHEPCSNKVLVKDLRQQHISSEEFILQAEELMGHLRAEFPNFIFSNKIKLTEVEEVLQNDSGTELKFIDSEVSVVLIIKHVDSANIYDTFIVGNERTFDGNAILRDARMQLNVFNIEAKLPKGEYLPVIVSLFNVGRKVIESLNGERLGRGTSIFKDKIGTKTFHEDFSLYAYRGEEAILSSFFDNEGSTLENEQIALIEDGVILRGYTDKKTAKEFGVPNTASAGGNYDEVPGLSGVSLSIKPCKKNLEHLIEGKTAVYVVIMSGGDCTNEGDFASPVQMSYLMKDGKLVGRLPEFSVSGNIYDIFGKDYIGYSSDKSYFGDHALVTKLKITC
jgi:PmbA protein